MPGSKRTYTYSLTPKPEDLAKVLRKTTYWLGWACDGDNRITCHETTGGPLGAVIISMTIQGRDRWWSTQLAQDILNRVLWGLESDGVRLDLKSVPQEPHDHRGYAHGRTKRYRERKPHSSSSAETSSSGS